jgi:hypothetical protein
VRSIAQLPLRVQSLLDFRGKSADNRRTGDFVPLFGRRIPLFGRAEEFLYERLITRNVIVDNRGDFGPETGVFDVFPLYQGKGL